MAAKPDPSSAMDVDSDEKKGSEEMYDLIVVGGGSGGLACAKEAAQMGAKVALFDFVKPTGHGTSWSIGGTCVNVGCIPKKLMHYSGAMHASFGDARTFGWDLPDKVNFDWSKMLKSVNNYVKSLNWGYRVQLLDKKVNYINAYASFVDEHTLKYTEKGESKQIKGKKILLAMGGRPRVPPIPGVELAITSDDLFWHKKPPGRTLCVGASYISLECAGFLHEMGFDTTIMVRSILLRGFDRECSEFIGEQMERIGIPFIKKMVPRKLEKTENGQIKVWYCPSDNPAMAESDMQTDVFDTVMFATGRRPVCEDMALDKAGNLVESIDRDNGKFNVNNEQTKVSHIYAIGDIVNGCPELTPVAIQAGKLLAKRLFADGKQLMDYIRIPTTVFTPIEYSCVGYSEEEAEDVYGEEDLEVYHQRSTPLEMDAAHRPDKDGGDLINCSFVKVICVKSENEKVVGFHYCGPHAGEVMQGFALALKLGVTKGQLDNVVGIHPTCAEWFTTLHVTKASGESAEATAC